MNRALIIAFLIGILGGMFFTFFQKNDLYVPRFQNIEVQEESPFSIEALREREFKRSEIKIEEELGDFASFKSYVISYDSDGLKIFALMNVPDLKKPKNGFPVVIVNHGYINPQDYSTKDSYRKVSDYYASQGYLVLKPDFRNHADSDKASNSRLERFNYVIDVLNLLHSVKNTKDPSTNSGQAADSNRIFMYGHSMGGEITLRVLEVTDRVKAATLWAPAVTEFPENLLYFIRRNRSPEFLREVESEIKSRINPQDYPKVSSLENTHLIKTPIVIHHGTADESVPFDWSEKLEEKLKKSNVDFKFYTYEGEDHNFTRGNWSLAVSRDLELFR